MIVCPSCHNHELVGALFCSACGAQLTYQTKSPTETVQYAGDGLATAVSLEPRDVPHTQASSTRAALKIVETGLVIPLEGSEEFTIGRVSGTQPILPDIDLTPYRAYEGGVSRLHATIRVTSDSISLSDLGSANGTLVNGEKITSYEPFPLSNGDIIALGKFHIEVIIRS
jgi:hypothetical protein